MIKNKKVEITADSLKVRTPETHRLDGKVRAHILDRLVAKVQDNKVEMDKLRDMGLIIKKDSLDDYKTINVK